MNNNLDLGKLNDRQKIWLSQVSYLNINAQGRNLIANGGINIYELKNYLENPEQPFVGDAGLGDKNFNFIASKLTGEEKLPTQLDVVNSLISFGLGNLKITDISNLQKFFSSGFQAMTFEDAFGNTGISYRGSDFNLSEGGIRDWVESDILEYFSNDSTQRKEALEYFEKNKNSNGKNYLYGHSLGGNLTSHVYAENHEEISQAFTINGNSINQKLLDTQDKIEAFNDPEKYSCNIICGDIVGHFKDFGLYKDNVNYIRNNEIMKITALSSHMVQAATFDKNGNFIKVDEQEMKEKLGFVKDSFMKFSQTVREILNKVEYKFENNKETFKEYKENLFNPLKNNFNNIGIDNGISIKDAFKNVVTKAELEEIQKIKLKVAQFEKNNFQGYEQNQGLEELQTKTR